ncbi:MAG: hypothetical protein K6E18_02100, partial [Lachnospiraceae bacterium]|nr:hypothetical protein [Lachnospiraceae bacterium]
MKQYTILKKAALCMLIIVEAISITSCASQGVTSANWEESKQEKTRQDAVPADDQPGTFLVEISMEGGTGKAYIKSPVEVTRDDQKLTAKLVWSSKNYDYMIVDGIRYENENPEGESTFTVTIPNLDEPLTVIGDTTAMSVPHEIEYVITWGKETKTQAPGESAQEEAFSFGQDQTGAIHDAALKALADAGFSMSDFMKLQYAKGFTVESCDAFSLLTIQNSGVYLVVEEGQKAPENLPE